MTPGPGCICDFTNCANTALADYICALTSLGQTSSARLAWREQNVLSGITFLEETSLPLLNKRLHVKITRTKYHSQDQIELELFRHEISWNLFLCKSEDKSQSPVTPMPSSVEVKGFPLVVCLTTPCSVIKFWLFFCCCSTPK